MAYLLLHPGEAISRARLAPTLSPDVTDHEARANLRRSLYLSQRILPVQKVPWFSVTATAIGWNADSSYWLDVDEFQRLIGENDLLADACDLYTSDLLTSCDDEWIDPIRRHLKERYAHTLGRVAHLCEEQGSLHGALRCVERLLEVDPWQEKPARDIMRLRALLGDRVGAIAFYRDFVRRLNEELGVEPSTETQAFFEGLARGDHGGTTPSPAEVGLSFHPLPLEISTFVGRSDEMSTVSASLQHSRVVTICGPAGVGKSRLALTLAHRVAIRYRSGAVFVDLAALQPDTDIAQHLARALNIAEDRRDTVDRLLMVLSSTAALIVLDNCEHVIDSVAHIAYELVRRCKNVTIVATSREPLAIDGETVFRLEPLKQSDAERLFLDRANSAAPSLHITDETLGTVGRICRRLDNLPLAIELAAGRVSFLTLPQIESRLAHALTFLTTGNRSALDRHQTLRAAIDWSYRLLCDEERLLLASLSIFRSGSTLDSVEAICSSPSMPTTRIVDHLASLASKSLIVVSNVSHSARYLLLDAIRSYSEEQLDKGDVRQTTESRHRDHFLQLVTSASKDISTANELKAIAEVEADYDNIRLALTWSLRRGDVWHGHAIALGLSDYWFINGMLSEARMFLAQIVNSQGGALTRAERSRTHVALARVSRHQGLLAEALSLDEAALALALESGDQSALGYALAGLAGDNFARGLFSEALTRDEQACEAFRASNNLARLGLTLQNMGAIQSIRGELEAAASLLKESVACHRACGDNRGLAYAILRQGYLAETSGDATRAAQAYRKSVELFRSLRDPFSLSYCLHNLSVVQASSESHSSAVASLREAIEISHAHGLTLHCIEGIERAVWLSIANDDPVAGASILGSCEQLRASMGSHREPRDSESMNQTMGLLRERLGRTAFEKLFVRGSDSPIDQLVVQALCLLGPSRE